MPPFPADIYTEPQADRDTLRKVAEPTPNPLARAGHG